MNPFFKTLFGAVLCLQSTLIGATTIARANDSSLDWSGTPRMMPGGKQGGAKPAAAAPKAAQPPGAEPGQAGAGAANGSL